MTINFIEKKKKNLSIAHQPACKVENIEERLDH